jgi:hypothetical protein
VTAALAGLAFIFAEFRLLGWLLARDRRRIRDREATDRAFGDIISRWYRDPPRGGRP